MTNPGFVLIFFSHWAQEKTADVFSNPTATDLVNSCRSYFSCIQP